MDLVNPDYSQNPLSPQQTVSQVIRGKADFTTPRRESAAALVNHPGWVSGSK
jgi:hypothetical protein